MYAERLRKTARSLRDEADNLREFASCEADSAIQRELDTRAARLIELADELDQLDYVRTVTSLPPEKPNCPRSSSQTRAGPPAE
jgi:hypothetical protein